jgi:hypothetical protein
MQDESTKATGWPTQRPAQPGEVCTCGRAAVVVYVSPLFVGAPELIETGWCGQPTAPPGPCPWCGADDHVGRCPDYRLRPDDGR